MKATTKEVRYLIIALALTLSAFWPVYSNITAAGQGSEKKGYVCPPCGCGRDEEVLERAGYCANCGMQLIEKGSAPPAHSHPQTPRKNVAILIFQGVQIIDYTGPYEVFGQAGFNVFTVAEKPDMITTAMGMRVTPNYTFDAAPTASVLVIPGGDVGMAQEDPDIIKWIQQESKNSEYVLSVCNGAFILAKTGLLDGMTATTFYGLLEGLKSIAPKVNVVDDRRYVDNGKFITTAGLSSGIDGSLYVISKILSKARAQMVALNMEYNWQPDSSYARASFADMHLHPIFGRGLSLTVPEGAELRVLSTEGGRDHWEINWLLRNDSTASDALKILNTRLASENNWSQRPSSTAANATRTSWRFTDKKGGVWNGVTSVQPVAGQKNSFNLTLRIDRADDVK
ncbi:MAG TPA: DJ-1/PfpI family protein [Blastocatellia bacterium]|nr:DJ-1/PfpI family protein [Blastocatellia bacterium]